MIKVFCDNCDTEQAMVPELLSQEIYRRLGKVGVRITIGSSEEAPAYRYSNDDKQEIDFKRQAHLCIKCASEIILTGTPFTPKKSPELAHGL